MIDLSLCIINRDDSQNLARLIKAARPYVGQVVVVDTGSIDDSIDAARNAGADIIRSSPELLSNGVLRSFSEARQQSFDLATMSWMIWLDTDDDLSDWEALPAVIAKASTYRLESEQPGLNLRLWYDYTWTPDRSKCIQSFMRERIVHREDNWRWERPIHEFLTREGPEPTILLNGIRVIHLSQGARGVANDRNLRILREWEATGTTDAALFYYLGDECMVREQYGEGFNYFVRCAASPQKFCHDRAVFRAARCLVNSGKYEDAITWLSTALEQPEPPANYYWELARALYCTNHQELAREAMLTSGSKAHIIGEDPTFRDTMLNVLGLEG